MKTISLDLPYKMSKADKDKIKNTANITSLLINTAVKEAYPDKMSNDASRIWAGIQEALFDLEKPFVYLDETQFGWLRGVVGKAEFPPAFASWLWEFRRHLDEVGRDGCP